MTEKNPYQIEIIGKAIGHADIIGMPWAPVLDMDFTKGNIFEVLLTGNMTLNVEKLIGGRAAIILKQDGTGGHTVTYDSRFKFSEVDPGDIASGANQVSVLDCINDPETGFIYATISPNYT